MSQLTRLQLDAVQLLAAGHSPSATRDFLQLGLATFETWRQDPAFVAAVETAQATSTSDALTAPALAEANSAFGLGVTAPLITRDEETL